MRGCIRRVRWVVLLSVNVVACQAASEPEGSLSEPDKEAIRAVFSKVVTTLRARDFDAFANTFAEDVVFHPANAPALHGREEVKNWVTQSPKATSAFDFTNVEIIGQDNFAFATSDIAMNLEGVPADKGKQLVVLRKEPSGEWKTVAVSFNSDTPMQAPPPASKTQ
jgi:uncharacterized protein (TIGR02246 family)